MAKMISLHINCFIAARRHSLLFGQNILTDVVYCDSCTFWVNSRHCYHKASSGHHLELPLHHLRRSQSLICTLQSFLGEANLYFIQQGPKAKTAQVFSLQLEPQQGSFLHRRSDPQLDSSSSSTTLLLHCSNGITFQEAGVSVR